MIVGALVLAFNFVIPPYIRPVPGEISSRYTIRKRPESVLPIAFEVHRGIDVAARYGTPIRATKSGRIAETGHSAVAGNYVVVSHWLGFSSYYAHLSEITVRKGQFVLKTRKIGEVGDSGRSTGPHLHFEIRWRGRSLPPSLFLLFDNLRRWVLRQA